MADSKYEPVFNWRQDTRIFVPLAAYIFPAFNLLAVDQSLQIR